ncbi:XRE family transcriptional regulator [Pseudorhodoferax sp. Leaf274]|uniref:XRE family transcriptional regulator n=1 Tax=Pseudorhodoferax sp. Leaf274 TaxID=1736318 RepID=UPI00138F737D
MRHDSPADRLKAKLLADLGHYARSQAWSKKEAARRFGVTRPRVRELLRGDAVRFCLEDLVSMAARAELRIRLTART